MTRSLGRATASGRAACVVFATLAGVGFVEPLHAEPPAANAQPDVQDLLYCAPRRPYLIRLHMSVAGQSFRRMREQWADARFAAMDSDANGLLEGDELKLLPAPVSLQPGVTVESAQFLLADSDPADGKITPDECRNYLLAATGTPFSVVTPPTSGCVIIVGEAMSPQVDLFPKLDADQDGKLSREEIAAAGTRLRRYDRNEDDVIEVVELLQGLPEQQAATQQRLSGVVGQLIVIDNANHAAAASRRLLERYEKAERDPATRTFRKDQMLSLSELRIDPEEFERADRNGDGRLDRAELAELSSAMTPTVELVIEIPSAAGEFVVRPMHPDQTSDAASAALTESGGRPTLVLDGTALTLGAAGPFAGVDQRLQDLYLQQFASMDQDKNNYLDRPELLRQGFLDAFFVQADTDRDGKLFEREYQAEVEREIELSTSGVTLEIGGDGRSLFRLIDDSPADGRLSLRELTEASARLMRWDANQDGAITSAELSIALSAVFRTGTPRVNGPYSVSLPAPAATEHPPTRSAKNVEPPAWFAKMDRNGDRDVSPNEFLGRRHLFDRIDGNGDGLISPDEAVAAHQKALAESPP